VFRHPTSFSIMLIAAICTLPALHWATEVVKGFGCRPNE
jgi:hypothetical protein